MLDAIIDAFTRYGDNTPSNRNYISPASHVQHSFKNSKQLAVRMGISFVLKTLHSSMDKYLHLICLPLSRFSVIHILIEKLLTPMIVNLITLSWNSVLYFCLPFDLAVVFYFLDGSRSISRLFRNIVLLSLAVFILL
jgi:hypothetical protein